MRHQTLSKQAQWMRQIPSRFVILVFLPAGVAFAQELPPPQVSETAPPPASAPAQQFAIDSSAVATSLGDASIDFNATFAPFGDINASGFRVVVNQNSSWYRFITGENPTTIGSGESLEGAVLAGYQFSLPRVNFIGEIGPAITASDDQGKKREQWGARTVLSMYALPSAQTMAFGSISYSTVSNFLQVQTKTGIKLVGNFYIGPEAVLSWRNVVPGINNIAEMRLGAQLSAVSFGPLQLGFSAGWAHQLNLGSGYYGSLSLYVTF